MQNRHAIRFIAKSLIMRFLLIAKILWVLCGVYWLISATDVKKTMQREESGKRLFYLFFWLFGVLLIFTNDFPVSFLYRPVYIKNKTIEWAGLICCMTGLIFAVWARATLGRNWSGRVTIKEGHELIMHGPYAVTRNPIYSGFLLGFLGSACLEGLIKGFLGLFILFIGMILKIYREENFMKENFGKKYQDYSTRVKRLIPFIY
jgi:protein-S-isoprenylcysteine O-methyltransferase Ste14